MKKIIGKKEDGVSPVIATILLIAITVVLASTVYIMVIGYAPTHTMIPLYATLTETQQNSATSAVLTLSMSSPVSIPVSDMVFHINGMLAIYTSPNKWTEGTVTITWQSMSGTATAISTGDEFIVSTTGTTLTGVTIQFASTTASGASILTTMY